MADIKLFVCCHQPTEVPKHPLLVPIQVGAALADSHFPGFLHDDFGDNISAKNRSYCELTAQYWAWKNVDADYYGFFHYRRYLYPDIRTKRPYRIAKKAKIPLLDKCGYKDFANLIQRYDLILPTGEDMRITVRDHYADAPFHHREHLELIEKIVRDNSPEYNAALEEYLSGTICYFGNIFIMRKALFQDYCKWLFPILKEFDKKANIDDNNSQEMRADGYLAERLLGVYETYHQEIRKMELPRIHFIPNSKERYAKIGLNIILPPGSLRRCLIKKMKRRKSWQRYLS